MYRTIFSCLFHLLEAIGCFQYVKVLLLYGMSLLFHLSILCVIYPFFFAFGTDLTKFLCFSMLT